MQKVAVDNLSTSVMNDETWRGIIVRSIPPTPKWLPVIPSLYAMSTLADIISTLFAHGMIIGRDILSQMITAMSSSNTVLAAQTTEGCMNPNCKEAIYPYNQQLLLARRWKGRSVSNTSVELLNRSAFFTVINLFSQFSVETQKFKRLFNQSRFKEISNHFLIFTFFHLI